jgi:hypothetical protein
LCSSNIACGVVRILTAFVFLLPAPISHYCLKMVFVMGCGRRSRPGTNPTSPSTPPSPPKKTIVYAIFKMNPWSTG